MHRHVGARSSKAAIAPSTSALFSAKTILIAPARLTPGPSRPVGCEAPPVRCQESHRPRTGVGAGRRVQALRKSCGRCRRRRRRGAQSASSIADRGRVLHLPRLAARQRAAAALGQSSSLARASASQQRHHLRNYHHVGQPGRLQRNAEALALPSGRACTRKAPFRPHRDAIFPSTD